MHGTIANESCLVDAFCVNDLSNENVAFGQRPQAPLAVFSTSSGAGKPVPQDLVLARCTDVMSVGANDLVVTIC